MVLVFASKADAAELVTDLAGAEAGVMAPDPQHLLLHLLRDLDARRLGHVSEAPCAFGVAGRPREGAIAHPAVEAPRGDAGVGDGLGYADPVREPEELGLLGRTVAVLAV